MKKPVSLKDLFAKQAAFKHKWPNALLSKNCKCNKKKNTTREV